MKFGLTSEQFFLIENTLGSIPEIEKVIIFGSRAGDSYKSSSDIDLAVAGKNVTSQVINRISVELDDLPLPFMFDILDINSLSNLALKNKITSKGKVFFERDLKSV